MSMDFKELSENEVELSDLEQNEFLDNESTRAKRSRSYVMRIRKKIIYYMKQPNFVLCILISIILLIVFLASVSVTSTDSGAFLGHFGNNGVEPVIDSRLRYSFEKAVSDDGQLMTFPRKISWVSSGNDGSYTIKKDGILLEKNVEKIYERVVYRDSELFLQDKTLLQYSVSKPTNDLKRILFGSSLEKRWRHGYDAVYYILECESRKIIPLTTTSTEKVALAMWDPSGKFIAWVRNNDLYMTDINGNEKRITTDGSRNVINAISDWVYEEEVLTKHEALWFSPTGRYLAFLKFNDTEVPNFEYQMFETGYSPYPENINIKYPKPGYPNPVVSLHVTSTSTTNSSTVSFSSEDIFLENDKLITEVKWIGDDVFLLRVMNRVQDVQRASVYIVRYEGTWKASMLRKEETKDGAWFNTLQSFSVIDINTPDGGYLEVKEDAKGFAHIAHYKSLSPNIEPVWITAGAYEVTQIVAVDAKAKLVYYISTEAESTQRHLYSVALESWGTSKKKLSNELPDVSSFPPYVKILGTKFSQDVEIFKAGFYDAYFSYQCGYYVLMYNGPGVPFSTIYKTNGGALVVLNDNKALIERLKSYNLPLTTYLTIQNVNKDAMNVKMLLPPSFDVGKKYPVLVKVYGGPNSQIVDKCYSIDQMTGLSDSGVIVVYVDARGTGFKGRQFRAVVSKQLGYLEVVDQLAAIKWLSEQSYIDETRIGIWGWSYGGYLAAKVLEANSPLIKLAISVAPVTDWRLYDSVYTERYMKLPSKNAEGYDRSAVVDMTAFQKKPYLLMHGTGDDNVHFQNSADLVYKFIKAGVQKYRSQYFTDSDHNIQAGGANAQVYSLLKSFLFQHFGM